MTVSQDDAGQAAAEVPTPPDPPAGGAPGGDAAPAERPLVRAREKLGKFRSGTPGPGTRIVYVDRKGADPRTTVTRGQQARSHHYVHEVDTTPRHHEFATRLPSKKSTHGFPARVAIGYRVDDPAEIVRDPFENPRFWCESRMLRELAAVTTTLDLDQASRARSLLGLLTGRRFEVGHGVVTWLEGVSLELDDAVAEPMGKIERRDVLTGAAFVDDKLEDIRHSGALRRQNNEAAAVYERRILESDDPDHLDIEDARARVRKRLEGDAGVEQGRQLLAGAERPELADPDAAR